MTKTMLTVTGMTFNNRVRHVSEALQRADAGDPSEPSA